MNIPDSGAFRISASAGSGKTHSLTSLFLLRMLQDKNAFRGMLAITFTNKAANELRERILKRLKALADQSADKKDDDLYGFPDKVSLAERASEVLASVLHNSDYLQVGTIDSFFQQVFTSLAIELGLPPGLKTELDLKMVKKEMLEEILLRKDPKLIRILVENLSLQLKDSGKDWRTIPYLRKKVLDAVFEEPVVSLFLTNQAEELSEEKLQNAAGSLRKFVEGIEAEVRESARAVVEKMQGFGLSPESFDVSLEKSFVGEMDKLWKAAEGLLIPPPVGTHTEKGSFHFKPKSRPLSKQEAEELQPLILRYGESRSKQILANHKLAVNLLRHIVSIRLLVFFRAVLQDVNRNQNRFLLNEVKYLLAEFLEGSEVPYLFEKTGSRLHTLLIDEFQDTDKIQWKVLRSLASVVVDNGGLFAVVGDVKQSIYGWRGADSSLFKTGLNQDLYPVPIREESLQKNYRSQVQVVAFNNWLFKSLAQNYAQRLLDCGQVCDISRWQETIRLNYQDVEQIPYAGTSGEKSGFAELRVRPKISSSQADSGSGEEEEEEENASGFDWLTGEIIRLQDAGFKASDIAVLVRRNSDAAEAIRILDKARRSGNDGYDFSFSTAANGKASEQALFVFMMLAMRKGLGYPLIAFELEQMNCLAMELGLDSAFTGNNWQPAWLRHPFMEREADAVFLEQVRYFGLDLQPDQQMLLVQFQELISRYLREDSIQYPDFFLWWQQKAGDLEVPLGAGRGGITVMTIHRSKGLDFGVVILPLFSTGSGDSKGLHDAAFWAAGEESPWDSHALLRGKASRSLLESDLGALYQEDVFKRAAEALNTFYVACTRPRYGLIIDITLQGNLDKPEKASYRLPFQAAFLLKNGNLPFSQEEFSIETEQDGFSLRFLLGKIGPPTSKKDKAEEAVQEERSFSPHFEGFRPKLESDKASLPARVGVLVHKILEKARTDKEWNSILDLENASGEWSLAEVQEAGMALKSLFTREEMIKWFSGDWISYPEMELLSPSGSLLRADRILLRDEEAIILDFKTGEEAEEHSSQILQYESVFEQASGRKASSWLVYSQSGKIKKAS